jgi:hypothetical protein
MDSMEKEGWKGLNSLKGDVKSRESNRKRWWKEPLKGEDGST